MLHNANPIYWLQTTPQNLDWYDLQMSCIEFKSLVDIPTTVGIELACN
jgi:hypothetical protein